MKELKGEGGEGRSVEEVKGEGGEGEVYVQ